jgi:hypothetical protein
MPPRTLRLHPFGEPLPLIRQAQPRADTTRTMKLVELRDLLAARPASATRQEYLQAVLDENVPCRARAEENGQRSDSLVPLRY